MIRKAVTSLALALLIASCASTTPTHVARIEASTDQAALDSFGRMLQQVGPQRARELQVAVLLIAMDGVPSAQEALTRPVLRNPSIASIKERVSGMTADEIISLSRTSTTKAAPTIR